MRQLDYLWRIAVGLIRRGHLPATRNRVSHANGSLPTWAGSRPLLLLPSPVSMLILLLLLLSLVGVRVHARGGVSLKVVSLMNSGGLDRGSGAIEAGFEASLAARGWGSSQGINISIVRVASHGPSAVKFLESETRNKSEAVIVLGPVGDSNILLLRDFLKANDIVSFAPIDISTGVRHWSSHLYFLTVEPYAELLALLHYAVVVLHLPRVGFMYLKKTAFGETSYHSAIAMLSRAGHPLSCVFAVEDVPEKEEANRSDFGAAWESFALSRPQAVLVFAQEAPRTRMFIKKFSTDPRTMGGHILAPSSVQNFLLKVWAEVLQITSATDKLCRLTITGTSPLANDKHFKAVERFRSELQSFLRTNAKWNMFGKPEDYFNSSIGEKMVLGWVTGEVLYQAVSHRRLLANRTTFARSLYKQRRYVINDLVIGDFGDECEEEAARQGATCHCNQGGTVVYMKRVVDDFRFSPVTEGFLTLGTSVCSSTALELSAPLSGVVVFITDNHIALVTGLEWFKGAFANVGSGRLDMSDRFFLHPVETGSSSAVASLNSASEDRILSAIFGFVTPEILAIQNMTFIDPITLTPHVNRFQRNVIHLSPTMEQQLYVLTALLADGTSSEICAIIRGEQGPELIRILKLTLHTFRESLDKAALLANDELVEGKLLSDGDTFVIGVVPDDVDVIATHLATHCKARVFVLFSDIALLHNTFGRAFAKSVCQSAERLVFATSLPHWADPNTTSETVLAYHKKFKKPESWSLLSLLGFATGQLMRKILQHMDGVTPELILNFFYAATTVTVNDMRYGPYKDNDCLVNGVPLATGCLSNSGATDIAVWSMARVLDPMVPVLQEPMIPSMVYSNPDALSTGELVAIVGGTVFAFMALVGLCVFLYCTSGRARNNAYAPKDPMDPVTLIFTDIESSTAQWAAHPELMPDAVAAHHRMIRSLITRYGCYEVKTVGDSFMIACESAFAAVQLARDMQQMFLHHGWGVDTFDCSYREFEECNAGEVEGYVPPTARLDPDVYRQLWNGLRVRVGIHTGLCDIRHDEVTKGYDYYGQTPNMAARTESVANGGQVLLTRAAYLSLSTMEREHLNVTPLGPVSLRGVPEPVEMYQLDAVPGRTFAPLRLDRMIDMMDSIGDGSTSASERSSGTVGLSESAQVIASSLQSLLGAFSLAQRQDILMSLCERWRVNLPDCTSSLWDGDYCDEVIRVVSGRVGYVTDQKAIISCDWTCSTATSSSVIFISTPGFVNEEESERLPQFVCAE
ncbi:unnamed protein product [Trypanosoma congolense IL3000]|uniref:adenylate cyclase n=1 Tax=Trypanosoma congolense (strain IL3000) TaxID=1068625 RepID=F9W9F3_TRYCI|nr:unnamed protein product [Trypanosoma congolense IL3000]